EPYAADLRGSALGGIQTVRLRPRARALGNRRVSGNQAGVRQPGRSTDRMVLMGAIQLRTSIPGPASKDLWRRRREAVPAGIYHAAPVFIARSEGALVEDVDGNRMIDFAGGIGCLNVGHRAPRVLAAVRAQLD